MIIDQNDKSVRVILQHRNVPVFSNGQNVQLCVVEELNPKTNNSAQASVTFMGLSLCLPHLHVYKKCLADMEENFSFDVANAILDKAILKGELDDR